MRESVCVTQKEREDEYFYWVTKNCILMMQTYQWKHMTYPFNRLRKFPSLNLFVVLK